MRKFLNTVATVSLLALATVQPVASQGVPVGDGLVQGNTTMLVTHALKHLGISTEELAKVKQILDTAKKHLDTARDTYQSITGARGDIAGMLETIIEDAQIGSDFDLLGSGAGGTDAVKARIANINEIFEFETGKDLFGADDATGRGEVLDIVLNSVRSSMVVSENNFAASSDAFERYGTYRETLGSGSTDLKSAIDLNTRVAIENGENMARMIQLLSALTEMDAVHRAANARARQQNRAMLRVKTE